jgi:hypothetical protein
MVRDPAQPYKDPRPHAADTPGGMVMSILHSASGDFEDEPSHRQSRGLLPP